MPDKISTNKAPRKKVIDFGEIQRGADEVNLAKALDKNTFNLRIVAACLRRLADGQISPDIVNKLADYLDPAIKNPSHKEGPKPKKRFSFVGTVTYLGSFLYLSENKEEARLFFNREKEAFALVENSEIYDADGNFSPQWKYPHAERKRQAVPLPTKGDIKDWFCEIHSISSRTFDDILARYNRKSK